MRFVCSELVNNECMQWVAYQPLLPELTIGQGVAIGSAIFTVLAFTFGIKSLVRLVRSS